MNANATQGRSNYRLLRLYAQGGAPVIRLLDGRYGISRREWRRLALRAAHREVSPSALGEQAHLDRPRTTRGVQMLVLKRLARRMAQPGDARRASVSLTRSDMTLCADLFPQIAAINARLVAMLDEARASLGWLAKAAPSTCGLATASRSHATRLTMSATALKAPSSGWRGATRPDAGQVGYRVVSM
jgi:DNA-binding MarR family transcriptional regulator